MRPGERATWKARAIAGRGKRMARSMGVDPGRFVASVREVPAFLRDLVAFRSWLANQPSPPSWELSPVLGDRRDTAGNISGHYFLQDLVVARMVVAARPPRHVDVGSRIDGFVGHLLTHMPVEVVDIRPLRTPLSGLTFVQDDATRLDGFATGSVPSLSSLHAVEHVGLGRYGDPFGPDRAVSAMRTLSRVLATGGRLYFSVPIGRPRIEFNAHRVFHPQEVLTHFDDLRLDAFSAIDDRGDLHEDVAPAEFADQSYGCGIFVFRKP